MSLSRFLGCAVIVTEWGALLVTAAAALAHVVRGDLDGAVSPGIVAAWIAIAGSYRREVRRLRRGAPQ